MQEIEEDTIKNIVWMKFHTSGWKLDHINVDDVDGIHNMDTNDDRLKLMNDTLKFSKTKWSHGKFGWNRWK